MSVHYTSIQHASRHTQQECKRTFFNLEIKSSTNMQEFTITLPRSKCLIYTKNRSQIEPNINELSHADPQKPFHIDSKQLPQ